MKQRILVTSLIIGALLAPAASAGTKSKTPPTAKPVATKLDDRGLGQRRVQRVLSVTLSNACAYRASVTGTVDGVRVHGRPDVQLLPDLHVVATLDCPREKLVRVSRHIAKERLAAADLDEALRGAMSIPTGGCFYVPELERKGLELQAKTVSWMCPSPPVAIGGGPTTHAKSTKPKPKPIPKAMPTPKPKTMPTPKPKTTPSPKATPPKKK